MTEPASVWMRFGVVFAFLCLFGPVSAAPAKFIVQSDGHPLALWARTVPQHKGAILLLHGRTWSAVPDFDLQVPGEQRSVMQALNAKGYSAYALDLRGYGATPRDASGWLTPDQAAQDLAAALRWIAKQQPDAQAPALLGWSMGSLVAQLAAQRQPELISDLILVGYPRDPAIRTAIEKSPDVPPREPTTRERAMSDFISPDVVTDALVETYVRVALATDPVRADWRDLHELNELDPAKVRIPTLLLHGERDPLTPADAQARLFTRLGTPDRQWIVLPGGDHAALIENTLPAFVAAITSFLERPRLARARTRHQTGNGDTRPRE